MDLTAFDPLTASETCIEAVQRDLAARGYYKGGIDGLWGPLSKDALRRSLADAAGTPAVGARPVQAAVSALVGFILLCLHQYEYLQEKVSNAVWWDPNNDSPERRADAEKLRTSLLAVGCEPGWSYCISGCWIVRKEAYARAGRASDFAKYEHLFSVSVLATWNNFHAAGMTSQTPTVGAILCLQDGNSTEGHAVTVTAVFDDHVVCTGFNTSPAKGTVALERNGGGVFPNKIYSRDFTPRSSGLWARGFIPAW